MPTHTTRSDRRYPVGLLLTLGLLAVVALVGLGATRAAAVETPVTPSQTAAPEPAPTKPSEPVKTEPAPTPAPTKPSEPVKTEPTKPADPDYPTKPEPTKPADPDYPTKPEPTKPADPDYPPGSTGDCNTPSPVGVCPHGSAYFDVCEAKPVGRWTITLPDAMWAQRNPHDPTNKLLLWDGTNLTIAPPARTFSWTGAAPRTLHSYRLVGSDMSTHGSVWAGQASGPSCEKPEPAVTKETRTVEGTPDCDLGTVPVITQERTRTVATDGTVTYTDWVEVSRTTRATDDDDKCAKLTEVTPAEPIVTPSSKCDTEGSVTLVPVEGVRYYLRGEPVAGTLSGPLDGAITAVALDGYELTDPQWSAVVNLAASEKCAEPATPVQPEADQPEADQPEADQPEADQPKAVSSNSAGVLPDTGAPSLLVGAAGLAVLIAGAAMILARRSRKAGI